jgi:hypothetical protein
MIILISCADLYDLVDRLFKPFTFFKYQCALCADLYVKLGEVSDFQKSGSCLELPSAIGNKEFLERIDRVGFKKSNKFNLQRHAGPLNRSRIRVRTMVLSTIIINSPLLSTLLTSLIMRYWRLHSSSPSLLIFRLDI